MKLTNPEIRAWWTDASGDVMTFPLDEVAEGFDRAPDGYALYVDGEPDSPQRHIADGDLEELEALDAIIHVMQDLAGIVLDGEPCPEVCTGEACYEGIHTIDADSAFDLLRFAVERARALTGDEPSTSEPTAYPEHLTGDRW